MRDDRSGMISDTFFDALLAYVHQESLLLHYAERRAERSALTRLDWDMIDEARTENAIVLQEVWRAVQPHDSSRGRQPRFPD